MTTKTDALRGTPTEVANAVAERAYQLVELGGLRDDLREMIVDCETRAMQWIDEEGIRGGKGGHFADLERERRALSEIAHAIAEYLFHCTLDYLERPDVNARVASGGPGMTAPTAAEIREAIIERIDAGPPNDEVPRRLREAVDFAAQDMAEAAYAATDPETVSVVHHGPWQSMTRAEADELFRAIAAAAERLGPRLEAMIVDELVAVGSAFAERHPDLPVRERAA